MQFIIPLELSKVDKIQILELWNNEYPERLGYASLHRFQSYLDSLLEPSHILMIDENKNIKGWYFDFVRKNEKWFALILDSSFHGIGLGTKLLNRAKQKEVALNGWVIDHNNDRKTNGALYQSPMGFYLKNGFKILAQTRLELDKISAVKIKWEK